MTKAMREWAAAEVPRVDVDRSTRQFVDYWRAASGAKATKRDWIAAWRFWLRRDAESGARGSGRPGAVEAGLSLVEELAQGERRAAEAGARDALAIARSLSEREG